MADKTESAFPLSRLSCVPLLLAPRSSVSPLRACARAGARWGSGRRAPPCSDGGVGACGVAWLAGQVARRALPPSPPGLLSCATLLPVRRVAHPPAPSPLRLRGFLQVAPLRPRRTPHTLACPAPHCSPSPLFVSLSVLLPPPPSQHEHRHQQRARTRSSTPTVSS
nr:unnamed protein product [Leishmania braziliensis]